ncbi:unnamed protein product [Linum trigynum]|uniref:Uncharacterized protein n=1 Tax=Linum trigynum TaxID=586398 RepID=A0AAV2E537_9ROSI
MRFAPRQTRNRTRKVRSVFSAERSSRPLDEVEIQRQTAHYLSDPRHGSQTAAAGCGQCLGKSEPHWKGVVSRRPKLPDRS